MAETRKGGEALEGVEVDCCEARGMCGLKLSTPEGCCRGRTQGMPEARGRHGDAPDLEVEGMMPVGEVALGNKGKGGERG